MIASLSIFGIDRGARLLRTGLIHIGYLDRSRGMLLLNLLLSITKLLIKCAGFGFHLAQSSAQYFHDEEGGVVRLEFDHNHDSWAVGQHFFLCFPALSIWQSHPLTVASVPTFHPVTPRHTYIVRCRKGETRRLKTFVLNEGSDVIAKEVNGSKISTTPVILCGPYGAPLLLSSANNGPELANILSIAGGTGVSLTLPLALAATSSTAFQGVAIDFIWIIRRAANMQWISTELEELKSRTKTTKDIDLSIHIYVTQEKGTDSVGLAPQLTGKETSVKLDIPPLSPSSFSTSSEKSPRTENFKITYLNSQKPNLRDIVTSFMDTRANTELRTRVIASGPAVMGGDLRETVAGLNDGGKVLRGERKWDVELCWDGRIG